MELDWTTVLLEILNFLVLVWLLKRFLYKPILSAIAQRKARIEQNMADAQRVRAEAEALREQYDNRLVAWERERQTAHARLLDEIGAERGRLLAEVQASLQKEREKAAAVEQRRLTELARSVEVQALAQGTRFATQFLSRVAGPELEGRIIDLVVLDLPGLSGDDREALQAALSSPEVPVKVTSAYPIQTGRRDVLTRALTQLANRPVTCEFEEHAQLVAGLRLSAGAWMLRASVEDELKFFAESAQNTHANYA